MARIRRYCPNQIFHTERQLENWENHRIQATEARLPNKHTLQRSVIDPYPLKINEYETNVDINNAGVGTNRVY